MGLVEGLYPGAAAAGLRDFPESTDDRRRRASARSTRRARSRSRGSAARRRSPRSSPAGARAAQRRGRQPRGAAAVPERPPHAARRSCRRSPVIGTDAPVQYEQREDIGAPRKRLPASRPDRERSTVADPRAIRVRARDQRRGRDRGARAARLRGADHRRRPQPAADDEAAAGQPRAPDRHQRPRRARLHPRGGRRDQDRRADPPRRPAEVRAARARTSRSSATPSR